MEHRQHHDTIFGHASGQTRLLEDILDELKLHTKLLRKIAKIEEGEVGPAKTSALFFGSQTSKGE